MMLLHVVERPSVQASRHSKVGQTQVGIASQHGDRSSQSSQRYCHKMCVQLVSAPSSIIPVTVPCASKLRPRLSHGAPSQNREPGFPYNLLFKVTGATEQRANHLKFPEPFCLPCILGGIKIVMPRGNSIATIRVFPVFRRDGACNETGRLAHEHRKRSLGM